MTPPPMTTTRARSGSSAGDTGALSQRVLTGRAVQGALGRTLRDTTLGSEHHAISDQTRRTRPVRRSWTCSASGSAEPRQLRLERASRPRRVQPDEVLAGEERAVEVVRQPVERRLLRG